MARVPDEIYEAVNATFGPSLPPDRGQLLYQLPTAAFLPNGKEANLKLSF